MKRSTGVFRRDLKTGICWGYSFFAGGDSDGKRLQAFKSGFPTQTAAIAARREAIDEHERTNVKVYCVLGALRHREWRFKLGDESRKGFTSREEASARRRFGTMRWPTW